MVRLGPGRNPRHSGVHSCVGTRRDHWASDREGSVVVDEDAAHKDDDEVPRAGHALRSGLAPERPPEGRAGQGPVLLLDRLGNRRKDGVRVLPAHSRPGPPTAGRWDAVSLDPDPPVPSQPRVPPPSLPTSRTTRYDRTHSTGEGLLCHRLPQE